MISLEPIEGNGWYDNDVRIPVPQKFFVQLSSGTPEDGFEGEIISNDGLNNLRIKASPRFTSQVEWLTVDIYSENIIPERSQAPRITGYARRKIGQ